MLLDEIKLPVQKRSQQRLEKVVEMAITILEKQGLENCTIPEVSFQSDVPKAHIYQYFPTINHLYILLIKRYLDDLQGFMGFKSKAYKMWNTQDITRDLILQVVLFYNSNKAASILILGGPVNVDGFNLQEIVIEKISENILGLLAKKNKALVFAKPEEMIYLVEIVFALMKHSFYKYQYITSDIQKESVDLSHVYLQSKGHEID